MHPAVTHLTLREKAELVSGASFWTTRGVEREGVESITAATLTDGPHGVRRQRASSDHLGINDSEPATSFPTAAATGSSWDPALVQRMGVALGIESRALEVDVLLGPGVNIKRSPLCGRNFEYFSEDPTLSGALGAAWVRGVQSQGVGASVKHFAANNQETDRMRISAEVDERTLREIYLPAFETTVRDAQPATVMCSYNRINGVFASENAWLLTDVLREDWGFDGYVVSDWGAVHDPVSAIAAGLDLEMPSTGERSPGLVESAVADGRLDESLLDRAVSRILTVHDRLRAARTTELGDHSDAHHALAREIASAGSVLLRNDGALLPLNPQEGGSIAVIGEFARTPRYQGAGSSHIIPTRIDNALDAITGATARPVAFAAGFALDDSVDPEMHDEAVALAEGSDTVILFLGLPDAAESEGFDREHLALPPQQLALFESVVAVNPRVVVVLSNGSVVSLEGIRDTAPAILEMWLGGQASGSAAADMLFGAVEPGGRLAETVPVALAHTPAHLNWPGEEGRVVYGERTAVGYRWYDATQREVAFPFGFGLSYTSFVYRDIAVTVPDAARAHAIVEVTVENTGGRAGSDVVQIYVGEDSPSVFRAPRELRAFEKVHLAAGERRTVRVELDERAFAYWAASGWAVDPGSFHVWAGPNSRDLPLQHSLVLEVERPVVALAADSTVEDWFAHPIGREIVGGVLTQLGPAGLSTESDEFKMVASMPLHTLIGFGEGVDADAVVESLLSQVHQQS